MAGLKGYHDDSVHVCAKHNHNADPLPGVVVHKAIRRVPGEIIAAALHRVRPAVAQQLVRGRTRHAFIKSVVRDIAFGVESLGELDFSGLCRRRGLPEPSRQVVRRGPRGRIYLDVRWDCRNLVVEIDGALHREGMNVCSTICARTRSRFQGIACPVSTSSAYVSNPPLFLDQVAAGLLRFDVSHVHR